MELDNQRILIFDPQSDTGERTAYLAAALGARVTLVKHVSAAASGELSHDESYQTVALDLNRQREVEAWLEAMAAPTDHLLVSHFAQAEPLEDGGTRHPWLGGAYQWAYRFARRQQPPLLRSVTLFSGPVVIAAGQTAECIPAEVEDSCVRWLARALRPLRVNAVRADPVRSPLPANPSRQDLQALYLSSAPHTRSRFEVGEDVARTLLYLMATPALSGSVLRIDNAPRQVSQ